jgi:Putative sensor
MDTTTTLAQSPAPDPAWRGLLRPLITWGGYRGLTHNLLGLPLGVAYFSWLVTALATGLGLVVTLIGIPILTLVLATIRPLLGLERGLANSLLDARIPAAPLSPGGEGLIGRAKAYWTDSATWRGITYLLGRFPVGLVTFTVAVSAYATALSLIAAPVVAPLDAIDLGFWKPDTVLDGLALLPLGLVLLLASAWISEGMAALSRAFARWGAR